MTGADEGQALPQKRRGGSSGAADALSGKRQKIDHLSGNIQPETRRSSRPAKPTERAKEAW